MRRKTLKAIACAAAMVLALSVTACGGSDDTTGNTGVSDVKVEEPAVTAEDVKAPEVADDDEAEVEDEVDTDEEADVEDEAETEDEDEDDADAEEETEYASLEEAFADPEVQAEMDDMISSMEEDGMLVSYEVSGNDFVVIYQFTDITVDDVDGLSEAMSEAMGQLEDMFVELAEMFDETVGEEGACTITVRCLDAAESLLFEDTYSAQ